MAEGAIGVGLDIGEASLGALFDIKASLDGMEKELHGLLDAEVAYQQLGPVQLQLRGSGVSGSSGNLAFGVGGPKYGRLWEIRRLIIGGLTYATTVAGSVQIFVSSVSGAETARGLNLADLVDQAASLPSKAFYSTGQIVLRHPQELHIVIVSPTATTQYIVGGSGFDIPDRPARKSVSE